MKIKIETRIAADLLYVRVRWLLLALAALMLSAHFKNPAVLGAIATGALLNLYASRMCGGVDRYEEGGARACAVLRFLDVLSCAATLYVPAMRDSGVWALAIPNFAFHALASRSVGATLLLAGTMAAAEAAALIGSHAPFASLTVPAVITAVGAAAGLAMAEYKHREERLRASDRRLASLLECGSELAASCDLDSTILHTLKNAVHETNATCGYVMLLDDNNKDLLVTEAAYGVDGEFEFPESIEVGIGLSGYVAKVGQPISVSADGSEHQDFDGVTAGVQSAACMPLIIRSYTGGGQAAVDQVLGVLTLFDLGNTDSFQTSDMELLRTLASLISVAVSNARMEERRRTTFLLTLESLATALEARDEYTRGHSQRVCEVSMMIGELVGLGAEAMEELRIGTILHDIGKIGVPDAILNKRSRLTDDEFAVMKSHPVIGYEICKPLMLSEGVLMIIRNHHEKLDGSGYPDGLKGGELPLSLRIVCVADAFDAMSSRRPYRSVMDTATVLAELSKGAGTQFDPVVVESLKELMVTERLLDLYRQYWGDGDLKAA
jgi:putative nucleotidyltransferase with HDIG domain